MKEQAKYPIKHISLATGFSQILIRTWENRYNLLKPERTETNRRLYSEDDLQKLLAIKDAIDAGFKIGQLAGLSTMEIRDLTSRINIPGKNNKVDFGKNIDSAIDYIMRFDDFGLRKHIESQIIQYPKKDFILNFVNPLLKKIGDLWENGELRISNEHFASAAIENALGALLETPEHKGAPAVVVCAPRNQNHKLAALGAAALLSSAGFRPIYLGASVPGEEIAATALKTNAIAVALSVIYPRDDFALIEDLKLLERSLDGVYIIVGGAASDSYERNLEKSRIIFLNDLEKLPQNIQNLRKSK